MRDWRDHLTYPTGVGWTHATTLDALASIYTVAMTGDRYVDWSAWLSGARDLGLITFAEHMALRGAIANCL